MRQKRQPEPEPQPIENPNADYFRRLDDLANRIDQAIERLESMYLNHPNNEQDADN